MSRYAGSFEHGDPLLGNFSRVVLESSTAGITIQAPQLDINTVAAGGGSILAFTSGMFAVGPKSAGVIVSLEVLR